MNDIYKKIDTFLYKDNNFNKSKQILSKILKIKIIDFELYESCLVYWDINNDPKNCDYINSKTVKIDSLYNMINKEIR